MEQPYKKYFDTGINADDDFELVEPTQWINAENIRVGSTDTGATKRVESIGGTDLLFDALPTAGTNLCIGGCSSDKNNWIIFMNWNSSGNHGIYCFQKDSGITYKVLLDEDVVTGLNFSKYFYIHSCFFVNNQLYWTNSSQNQPRRINVERGIKAHHINYPTPFEPYSLPMVESVIRWIRRPPGLPLTQVKVTQTDPKRETNLTKYGAFQFCYAYQYQDFELSTLSAYTTLANYNAFNDTFNRIDVTVPYEEAISQDVLMVNMYVRYVHDDTFYLVRSWNRNVDVDAADIAAHNSHTAQLSFAFYNDTVQNVLDDAYKTKLYDSVPLFVETAANARDRNFLANYTEGYDTPLKTSLEISYNTETIPSGIITSVTGWWYDYALRTNPGVFPAVYFRIKLVASTLQFGTAIGGAQSPLYFYETNLTINTPPPYPSGLFDSDLTFVGRNATEVLQHYAAQEGVPLPVAANSTTLFQDYGHTVPIGVTGGRDSLYYGVYFKTQGAYRPGITFLDEYQRKCGELPISQGGKVFRILPLANNHVPVRSVLTNTLIISTLAETILVGDRVTVLTSPIAGSYTITAVSSVPGTQTLTTLEPIDTQGTIVLDIIVQRADPGESTVIIPDGFLDHKYVRTLQWALRNDNAIMEIPKWAHYYSIDITKCLTTRFFIQGFGLAQYVAQDTNGLYIYGDTSPIYHPNKAGIAIDTSTLSFFRLGYSFNTGDICRFVVANIEYSLNVIDTDGKYIILENVNVGSLAPTEITYEVFTPYKREDLNEPYYEVGQLFQIISPETDDRTYGTLAGEIGGDVHLLKRATFVTDAILCEAMNPNDKFWQQWLTDSGRINVIDTIGQVTKQNSFCWSDVYIGNTKINGLSSYYALNTETVPVENGPIRKLQLAQKVAEKGTVMLAISEEENCSIYLGETNILDNNGSAFLVKTVGLIGSIYALRGSMGTKDPESVFEYNGLVIYWDARNGTAVQYSDNGLDSLSKNGLSRASNLFSKKYSSLTPTQIEALGSRPYIIGGVDPHHKEFVFTIPSTEARPPKGYLDDYEDPQIIYPYDIYDGKGKTLRYKQDKDHWLGSATFQAEKFIRLGQDLYSFNKGRLFKHNSTRQAYFYGEQHTAKIMFSANPMPGTVKTNLAIEIQSNLAPKFAHFRTEKPYIQSSDLVKFKVSEGMIKAGIMRDRLSPNVPGDVYAKWLSGDKMFGKYMLSMLEFDVSEEPLDLILITFGYNLNTGHLK